MTVFSTRCLRGLAPDGGMWRPAGSGSPVFLGDVDLIKRLELADAAVLIYCPKPRPTLTTANRSRQFHAAHPAVQAHVASRAALSLEPLTV